MMTRWWQWLVWLAVVVGTTAAILDAQPQTITLAVGRFGGTEQEILECVYSIGAGAALLLHPQGEPCRVARDLVGRTGVLIFVTD